MDDLARGWAIFVTQGHGRFPVFMLVILIAALLAVAVGMWAAMRDKWRKDQAQDFRPLPRTRIPGSEKDYRR